MYWFCKKNLDIDHLPPSSFSSRNSLVYCSVTTFSSYIPFTWDINVLKVWHSFSSRFAKDWTSANRTVVSYDMPSRCRSFKTPPSTTHHKKPSVLERVSASARSVSPQSFSLTCSRRCWIVCWSFTRRLQTVWSQMLLDAAHSCSKNQSKKWNLLLISVQILAHVSPNLLVCLLIDWFSWITSAGSWVSSLKLRIFQAE